MSDDTGSLRGEAIAWSDHFVTITNPEMSEWSCYLFGNKPGRVGLVWRPEKGTEPNWFWRQMHYLVLGNLWVKDPPKAANPS